MLVSSLVAVLKLSREGKNHQYRNVEQVNHRMKYIHQKIEQQSKVLSCGGISWFSCR